MAKGDLVGGSLWDNYSRIVADRMNDPRHLGEISEEEAQELGADLVVADHGAESCGDAVRLYWAVSKDDGRIKKATFRSFGCGTAIASSDMMAELCIGKTVDEAVAITNLDVEQALRDDPDTPAVPPQKMHCSVMAYDVIKAAAATYKGVDVGTLEDAEMVCECARVTLSTVKEVIRLNDLKTVEEITSYTKAGAFCKSCVRPGGHETRKYYLEDILAETRAQMERENAANVDVPFAELGNFKKFKAIERVLDAEVRPALHQDGGDVDVDDFRMDGDVPVVTISYKGACLGCMSATVGTLGFIENVLKDKLDSSFKVEVG
ncbi:MAG: iron-sulfur cluster assembly scaffold protein [Spirochaetales bacterium]|nr:iron-sulfur cluster assembly scaffold protein [Spirochaetales bacterium]